MQATVDLDTILNNIYNDSANMMNASSSSEITDEDLIFAFLVTFIEQSSHVCTAEQIRDFLKRRLDLGDEHDNFLFLLFETEKKVRELERQCDIKTGKKQ